MTFIEAALSRLRFNPPDIGPALADFLEEVAALSNALPDDYEGLVDETGGHAVWDGGPANETFETIGA